VLAIVARACSSAGAAGVVSRLRGDSTPDAGAPTSPPADVCGNAEVLDGPSSPPTGAVRIEPGQDLQEATLSHDSGTTFWLAPGVHVLAADEFGQVIPKDGNSYIGAPGAVLDGGQVNRYLFTGKAAGVTIRHLTSRTSSLPVTRPSSTTTSLPAG
jgi:hypothetical protein